MPSGEQYDFRSFSVELMTMAEHQLQMRGEKMDDNRLQDWKSYEYEEERAERMMQVSHASRVRNCLAMTQVWKKVWVVETWQVRVMARESQE